MLHINDLVFRIAGRVLFDGATVQVPVGHKVGLVGRNGSGKTTLFRLILGQTHPDSGRLRVRSRARVGQVAQEAPGGSASLIDTVLAADAERAALLAEADHAHDPHRIADIHERLAVIDAHAAPARAGAILAGLGFDEAAQARRLDDYSGGWRMRVALAAALFARPDLLLLDEPTNHLDLEATLWLEEFLASYPGTMIVISHERRLLNNVVDEIIHVDQTKLVRYAGNYDRFERTRRERLAQQNKARDRQINEQKRIQAFVDRFRAKATKARQAQSRLKALARMEPIAAVIEDRTPSFAFPSPEPLPPPIVALEGVSIGYEPQRPVLRNLNLRIDMDDRIGLLGANGNGKSTLVRLLSGRLAPQTGRMATPPRLKTGYFAQFQTEELDVARTPFDHMNRLLADAPESKVRAHLGRFGFGADKADTAVGSLSGGEKARLLFALMSRDAPHMLLLDEPTNHLDVDAREALIEALNDYAGAVILVSHDPHMLELVCDRLWLVDEGACKPFDGDLDDYRRLLLEKRRGPAAKRAEAAATRKDVRRDRAQLRAETAHLRKAANAADKEVERLTAEQAKIEAALADPALYGGPAERIAALQRQRADIAKALAAAEQTWLEAHEALDAAGL